MKPPRRPSYARHEEPEIHAGGEEDPDFPEQESGFRRKSRGRGGRLIPLLVFAGIGLVILKQQVPAVNEFYLSIVKPDELKALEACRETALKHSKNPDFARIVHGGLGHATQNGHFIQGLTVGELVEGEGEVEFLIECHVDRNGRVVSATRTRADGTGSPIALTGDAGE